MLFTQDALIKNFKYMVEFVTNILIIKNICEVINDSLIIIYLFFIFTNWT
jgi:hypothetical protein